MVLDAAQAAYSFVPLAQLIQTHAMLIAGPGLSQATANGPLHDFPVLGLRRHPTSKKH